MNITRTRRGLRLSQHGVVISELRITPGPTHSVFDVLAALVAVLAPAGRIGLLGFAGGGMMAPLRGLGMEAAIDAVDLDPAGYKLFRQHCRAWAGRVRWQRADAAIWLRRQAPAFGLLLEDLSIPWEGDVIKPDVSWGVLPGLMRARLRPGGIAVFNLLRPTAGTWKTELPRIAGLFRAARLIRFEEYENRILVAGDTLPPARALGALLRRALHDVGSRQARRIEVQTFINHLRRAGGPRPQQVKSATRIRGLLPAASARAAAPGGPGALRPARNPAAARSR